MIFADCKNKNTRCEKNKKIVCKKYFKPRLESGIEIASYSDRE
jgi:hypothetical protein